MVAVLSGFPHLTSLQAFSLKPSSDLRSARCNWQKLELCGNPSAQNIAWLPFLGLNELLMGWRITIGRDTCQHVLRSAVRNLSLCPTQSWHIHLRLEAAGEAKLLFELRPIRHHVTSLNVTLSDDDVGLESHVMAKLDASFGGCLKALTLTAKSECTAVDYLFEVPQSFGHVNHFSFMSNMVSKCWLESEQLPLLTRERQGSRNLKLLVNDEFWRSRYPGRKDLSRHDQLLAEISRWKSALGEDLELTIKEK